jgi:hypothetical protein
MTRLFDITTTTDALALDASGKGKLAFTVTNTTQKPQRATLRVRGLDSSQAGWFTLGGDAERDFPAGFTHQVELAVAVPAGTPAGKFRVRLDALSVANPDDDFVEGQAISVTVAAPAPPPPPKSMWWVWLIVGVVVLVIAGVVAFLVLHKPKPAGGTTAPASSPTTTPTGLESPKTFDNPTVITAQGPVPLDYCREWGTNCGVPAADAFCRTQGYVKSVDWALTPDRPPTAVISSKQVCADPQCDRIVKVVCTTSGGAVLMIRPERMAIQRQLLLKGKQLPADAASAP